ncbi:glycosyltransferase family protein [Nitrosopumilus sp. b2]|uniref:glycosyltransferase family protein n=1 Tax=Nitrosopumilus sp. b2 TaxID=2109908 RepID=UPI0015F6CFB1|nr:glycosyltransferase family protein [Nitrosopumilus sp. b2]KAF6245788.1 hypothetical protein C6989_01235 [Nitrosopumilus sp. b2]
MKRIVVYVSDHGYGHAARAISLLREFKSDNYEIIIKNSNAFNFLKKSLPETRVINWKTDVGPITNISKKTDSENTFKFYSNWIKNEKKWLSHELDFFKNKKLDLVISDISPMGIRFAKKINVPSITVANFTWNDILKKFPSDKRKEEILDWLCNSFGMTDLAIKTPLSMELDGLKNPKKSSLLCRSITTTQKQLFKKLFLNHKPITVYLGSNFQSKINISTNKSNPLVQIINNDVKTEKKTIKNFTEVQNIISISNFVISKPGYGIISECINSRCPIFLIPRKNYPEDELLCKISKKLGIATVLDLKQENYVLQVPTIDFNKLKNNIDENQIKKIEKLPHVSKIIHEFLSK